MSVSKWRHTFVDAGTHALDERRSGPAGVQGSPEQRKLRAESEQLKLALAKATVQLRIWQHGAQLVDAVPSPTSKP